MGSNFHSAQPTAFAAAPIELSVVVPTFKEAGNVTQLVELLEIALLGIHWEVIFVDDDSPDGTAELVRQLALERDNVRCVQRIGRRGLTSACVEGILASASPIVAVMDCGQIRWPARNTWVVSQSSPDVAFLKYWP